MKAILTNRTYQIIAGSAFLVMLAFLYVTSTASEDTVTATPIVDTVTTQDINKVETTTVANDNVPEGSEKTTTTTK